MFDSAGPPLPQLSRTVVPGGEVIRLLSGCFRAPGLREVLVAKRNALQVCSESFLPQRPPQPLFGDIVDLQSHAAADCIGLEGAEGLDLAVALTATGNVAFLRYCPHLERFVNAVKADSDPGQEPLQQDVEVGGRRSTRTMLSLRRGSPFIVTASKDCVVAHLADFRTLRRHPANPAWLPSRSISTSDQLLGEPPQFPNISAVCQIASETSKDGVNTVYLVLCSHFHTTKRARCGLYAFKFSADGTALSKMGIWIENKTIHHSDPFRITALPPGHGARGFVMLSPQGISLHVLHSTAVPDTRFGATLAERTVPASRPGPSMWTTEILLLEYKVIDIKACCWLWGDALIVGTPDERTRLQGTSSPHSCDLQAFAITAPRHGTPAVCVPQGNRISVKGAVTDVLPIGDSLAVSLANGSCVLLRPKSGMHIIQYFGEEASLPRMEAVQLGGAPTNAFVAAQSEEGPLGVAAVGEGAEGGLAFVRQVWPAPLVYQGEAESSAVSNIWTLKCFSSDAWHTLIVVSFAEATRAFTAGHMMQDVSETVGICEGERTIACGEIGEGYLAQVTPSQVRFCSMMPLQDESESEGSDGTPRKRSSLSANFGHLNIDGGPSSGPALTPSSHGVESGMEEENAGCPEVSIGASAQVAPVAADNVWRPPQGLSISVACCCPGWVIVYTGGRGRGNGSLAALQYARAKTPVKRKRGNQEEWRMTQVAGAGLSGDPSCMDIRAGGEGRYTIATCLHGGGLQLFDLSSCSLELGWSLVPIYTLGRSQLGSILAAAGLNCQAVLGTQAAESVHLLRDHQQEGQICALVALRSGHILHLALRNHEQAALLGVADLGPRPPICRRLPESGGGEKLLAVGCRSAYLTIDEQGTRMTVHWLSLPKVYHAAPMNVAGKGNRYKRMLFCATRDNNLQLREFKKPPGLFQTAPAPHTRPLGHTPHTLLSHQASCCIIALHQHLIEVIEDHGRGAKSRMRLPGEEFATCATTWHLSDEGVEMSSDMEEDPAEPSQMPSTPAEGPLPPDDGNAAARDMQMDAPAELPRGNAEPPWLGWEAAPPLRSASADEAAGLLMEMAGASLSDAAEGSAAGDGERGREAGETPSHAGHRVGGASKADAAMQIPMGEVVVIGTAIKDQGRGESHPMMPPTLRDLPPGEVMCDPVCGRLLVLVLEQDGKGGWFPKLVTHKDFPRPIDAVSTVRQGECDVLLVSSGPCLYLLRFSVRHTKDRQSCLQITFIRRCDRRHNVLASDRGSWGVAAADVEHGCQLWAKPLSTPAAGGSPAPDKGTLRQLQQLASGVGAPDSPKPQPDSPKVDSIEVVACSDRRRSVSACLPLQCLWRPGLPAAQQDAGLLMTAESSGVVSTLGWCPQYSPAECRAHHEARGMTFWGSDAANMLPTVFPDRSAANLGAPLVVLLRGSLVPAVEEEVAPISFLAAGSCGQVFSVENLEPEEAFLLRAVESVLQEHAIAQPLNLSHSDYRRGTSTVKKERLIIDGDLLGEYQHLPQESQESIATSLQITLGRPFQPAGIVALLRKWV